MSASSSAGAAAAGALLQGLRQQFARFAADGLPLAGVVGAAPRLRSVLDLEAALTAGLDGGGQDGALVGQPAALVSRGASC